MKRLYILTFLLLFGFISITTAQIPKPEDVYGFQVGADYKLASYEMMLEYFDKLEASTNRVKKIEIGKSALGKPMLLLFISSEENIEQLDKWKDISSKLARARINKKEAEELSIDGKAIVYIDGGMHAREMAHGQMTSELAYKVASGESFEMKKIRDNVIFLLQPVFNPDGVNIVRNWYYKNLGTPFETTETPWLWHYYIGHDNNRDAFMANMPETKAVLDILFREWYPQINYNHHQTSPPWARIFIPPFNDPININIHPGMTTSINELGMTMQKRLALEGKPGAVTRLFSMHYTGAPRNAGMRHNQIGILTETAHNTPTPRYYDPKDLPKTIGGYLGNLGYPTDGSSVFYPYPWKGGESHFRDAVEYMITTSMAVLRYAADRKTELLYNMYSMGRDAIEKRDGEEVYAYVIPNEQWDKWEANHLVDLLVRGGLEIEKATKDFMADGKPYKAGSYILYTAQPFAGYVKDLLDEQYYPTIHKYPGGPTEAPYDITGWTLPYTMGVKVDRIKSEFKANGQEVSSLLSKDKNKVEGNAKYGFVIDAKSNIAFKAVNQFMAKGATVERVVKGSEQIPAGSFLVTGVNPEQIDDYGLSFQGVQSKPTNIETKSLKPSKVGLYKSWMANMDEGWTRWILEEYGFEMDTLHNNDIKSKDLSKYGSIILPDQNPEGIFNGYNQQQMPKEYTGGIGVEGTLALKKYVENGGTLITFDKASLYAMQQFGLPLRNAIQNVSEDKFVIPGSPVRAKVNTQSALGWGMQNEAAAEFLRSFAFDISQQRKTAEGGVEDTKDAPAPDVEIIVNYAEDNLIMSGWGIGAEKYIGGKPAMVRVPLGKGQIILFAFRPQFRAETPNTYKLIFNSILH